MICLSQVKYTHRVKNCGGDKQYIFKVVFILQSVYNSLDKCSWVFLADDAKNLQNCISKEKWRKKKQRLLLFQWTTIRLFMRHMYCH